VKKVHVGLSESNEEKCCYWNRDSFSAGKAAGTWSWPLNSS